MSKRFILVCFLLIYSLSLSIFISNGNAANLSSVGKRISPVYEEMLANQIYLLWRELLSQKAVQEQDPFYIQSIVDDQSLTVDLGSILKKYHPSVNWRTNLEEDGSFAGILLIPGSEKLPGPNIRSGQGYLMVFVNEPEDKKITAELNTHGFTLHSELSLFELEYVKDEKGRQIIDLDRPRFISQIFERLVQEGMNPVNAHLAADEAIKDFRKLKKPKLVIFDRISA